MHPGSRFLQQKQPQNQQALPEPMKAEAVHGPKLVKIVRDWVSQTPDPHERSTNHQETFPPVARQKETPEPPNRELTISIGSINLEVTAPTGGTQVNQAPARTASKRERANPFINRLDRHYLRF